LMPHNQPEPGPAPAAPTSPDRVRPGRRPSLAEPGKAGGLLCQAAPMVISPAIGTL
jgi:hypothetical protein